MSNRSKRVVTVCRLHAQKNLALAIDAFQGTEFSFFLNMYLKYMGRARKKMNYGVMFMILGLTGRFYLKVSAKISMIASTMPRCLSFPRILKDCRIR